MEITMEMIVMIITAIMTAVFGMCAKKWNWDSKEYIPFQNLAVGIVAGMLVFATGLSNNILQAIILCVFSAMTAGGTYDLIKTNKNK